MIKAVKKRFTIEDLKKGLKLQLFSDGGDSGQGGDGGGDSGNGGKTFTQEDIDKIVKSRVAETKRASEKAILESLGVEKVDDLKAIIEAKKKADDEQKTEAQKLQEQNQQLAKEKDEAIKKANTTLMIADFKVKAVAEGLDAKQVEAALKLADMANVKVNDDGIISGTEEVIKKVLEDYPFLKGNGTTAGDIGGGAGGNPGGGDGKGGKTSIGQRLAQARKQQSESASKAQNVYFK